MWVSWIMVDVDTCKLGACVRRGGKSSNVGNGSLVLLFYGVLGHVMGC